MMKSGIIPGIIGGVVGGFLIGFDGLLFGLAAGFLAGAVHAINGRVRNLENRVADYERRFHPAEKEAIQPAPAPDWPETPVEAAPFERPLSPGPAVFADDFKFPDARPSPPAAGPTPSPASSGAAAHGSVSFNEQVIGHIRDFFTRGNVVVRIGLVVLFFGVAFLIKYAAERNMLPIELRLCAAAAGGIFMLGLGWHLRLRRPGYAMLIQGGGVGILYLTVFAAARMYGLLPAALGFFLLVGLVFLSAVLALLADARAMALFATAGGFLAPVLMSTGRGDHVFLFSFYALLNAGILCIAWFKAWRELNLAGFLFTFVIGTAWGVTRYRPEFFASTEPFLVLFFLFYAAISVLYAHRQPINLKGYIDGPLVFGLPLIIFGLQAALVRNYEYGMAVSAVALSAFYLILVQVLWKRRLEGMRMLAESYLSLGVVFASLAIPLAFDSSWTSGLWGLEGAGLVWIGLRQNRLKARCFGLVLQAGAMISFLHTAKLAAGSTPVLNGVCMSCLFISLAGFISNYCYVHFKDRLRGWEDPIHILLIIWALAWWLGGGINEIERHIGITHELHAALLFIAASAWVTGLLHGRFNWSDMAAPPMGLLPVMTLIAAGAYASGIWRHPFSGWGGPAWGMAIAIQYHLLWRLEKTWKELVIRWHHSFAFYLALFLAAWESAWVIEKSTGGAIWGFVCWGAIPALAALLMMLYGRRMAWPVRRFAPQYLSKGMAPVMGCLWVWVLAACVNEGNPAPLPYVPVANPVEIAQVFALLVITRWWMQSRGEMTDALPELPMHAVPFAIGGAAFFWLNGVIARTVHFRGGVPYDGASLFDSVSFQASISIIWTITALCIMVGATRRASRMVWFVGSVVLGLVVAKLFLVDLDGIGTVARIISFLVVGVLMLVIGYFSPLPPKQATEAAA